MDNLPEFPLFYDPAGEFDPNNRAHASAYRLGVAFAAARDAGLTGIDLFKAGVIAGVDATLKAQRAA